MAILGRTDLRRGVSGAKFDAQADFDVKKSLAPPKSAENLQKPKKVREKNSKKKKCFVDLFFDSESFETRFGKVSQVKKLRKTGETSRKNPERFAKIRESLVLICFNRF